ncbi:unnamed protein product [Leptosia nina]|uniref:Uncharacterized protein n=1 Tax=Leptosia nina TaxID=320188 RepID=A0AAV1JGW0_9NEOP
MAFDAKTVIFTCIKIAQKQLDNVESRIFKLEESVLQLGANNQHSCEVNGEVELLKRRLNQSEQQCLMNDVEIAGVFEANGENTEHVAISLAQILELFEQKGWTLESRVTRKVDILAVKETWLREGETGRAPQVTGYRLRHIPRPPSVRTRGGGVGFYINKMMSVRLLSHPAVNLVEQMWMQPIGLVLSL